MFPDWMVRLLEGMGVPGGIIFVLLSTVVALVAYIKSMQAKADKIYGYRLTERDSLNKALTDAGKAISDLTSATEDRNELTEEQARLLEKQAQAFELLKVTVLAQYDSIKDHNAAASAAVTAMAESIRALTSIVLENRTIAMSHVNDVRKTVDDMSRSVSDAIKLSAQTQIVEMRMLLGQTTTVVRRKNPS
jgi:hypothetical protein